MDGLLASLPSAPLMLLRRLSPRQRPLFLKFCSRVVFSPDDKGLFPGIYLPLDLWKRLHSAGRLKGPRGGNVLGFANVGRKLSNSDFIQLEPFPFDLGHVP